MQFIFFGFLLFFGALLLLYYTVPQKCQWLLLLIASWLFYLAAGVRYLAFLMFTTLTTYAATRAMDRAPTRKKKNRTYLLLCLTVNFAILTLCKFRFTVHHIALPMGISFYMFQSMGYVIDVYRGRVKAEQDPLRLALCVSYFPCLVQGPICKYSQLAPELFRPHLYDGKQVSFGLQRMLWGYFKKLVIADRIAAAVITLKAPEYTGISFLVLTVFYAVQIYGDFTGGIDIALGLSEALGIRLPENFLRPFFSKSIAEYWRRWHITLGVWMKDYIFYPLSVSAPLRKLNRAARAGFGSRGKRLSVYAATFVTWFVTGIWHGLTPNFLLWGMLNCLVIVISQELAPLYAKFHGRFHLKQQRWYGAFEIARTFLLMNLIRIVDLFPDVGEYFRRLGSLFTSFRVPFGELGLTALDYGILIVGAALMIGVSLFQETKGSLRQFLWDRVWLRYGVTFGLFLIVLLMGRYGIGYDAGHFIYNQF